MHDTNHLLTQTQAAAHVGCSDTTIYRAITAGELEGHRFGHRTVLIAVEDLDAWAAERHGSGGDDAA